MLPQHRVPNRRRVTLPLALSLPLAFSLPLLLAGLVLGLTQLLARPPQPSSAQAPVNAEVRVALHGNTVAFSTLPYTLVSAELADAGGLKAEGIGYGDATGEALIVFPVGSATILPGDSLTLSRPNDRPLVVQVPDLVVDLDAEGDRIGGRAPAGARLQLSIRTNAGSDPVEREASAGTDGSFLLELAGELDLAAGQAAGEARYDSPEGYRFSAPFAALGAQVSLGAPVLRGQASPGTSIEVEVEKPGGERFTLGPTRVIGDPSYALGGAGARPLEAGDRVRIRQTGSPLPEAARAYSVTLQAVTIALDPQAGRASGSGPADTPLQVSGDDMDGNSARWELQTAADGNYGLDLGDQITLGPGWRLRAAYPAAPGIDVGAVAVLRKARVGVGLPFGQGRVEPGHLLTVTLKSESGAIKARGRAFSGDRGDYSMPFGQGAAPAAGDRIEIELDSLIGDPFVLSVPQLTAASDPEGDRVTGQAPPDTEVDVIVSSADGEPLVTTLSGADGSYSADFGAQLDLERPSDGLARIRTLGGDEFVTTWAAMRLAVSVGSTIQGNYVTGNGPIGRFVTVQLLTPAGEVVGQAAGPVFSGGIVGVPGSVGGLAPQFFVQLADTTGRPVQMRAGDSLRVVAGDERIEVEIPPIDAVVVVEGDRITGRTGPDLPITIRLADSPVSYDTTVETRSDAAGRFNVDLTGKREIRFGDFIQLAPQVDGHEIFDIILAPGLVVDLDQAIVLGSLAPDLGLEVTLRRGTAIRFQQQTGTDATGAFFTQFPGEDGTPFILEPGDLLTVRPSDPTILPLELRLPALELDWDVATDRVGGRTQTDGELTLFSGLAYARAGSFGFAQGWPAIAPDGRFEAEFVPRVDLRPGHKIIALLRPPEGHYVTRSRTVPILNAEHSGPNACGFGAPRETLEVALAQAGQPLASSSPGSRFDGYFSTVHRDSAQQPVKAEPGQRVATTLDAAPVALELPALNFAIDWQRGVLQAQGPPNATWYLGQALPCSAQQQPTVLNIGPTGAVSGQTDAEGKFATGIGAYASPGAGFEIAFFEDDAQSSAYDHRFFRQAYRALARIFIHTSRVDGRSNALDATRVALQDATGTELASQAVQASTDGYYAVDLVDAAGDPVLIEAGQRVLLETPGESREITVEPLEFDWSAGSPIFGNAPPNRPVQLQLRLSSGAYLSLALASDAEGRIAYTQAEVPPRSAWSLDDVIGVRLTLTTPEGHQIIDQTPSFVGPLPQPEGPARIYLPAAYRAAGGRALAGQPRALPSASWLPLAADSPPAAAPAAAAAAAAAAPRLTLPWALLPLEPFPNGPAPELGPLIEQALQRERPRVDSSTLPERWPAPARRADRLRGWGGGARDRAPPRTPRRAAASEWAPGSGPSRGSRRASLAGGSRPARARARPPPRRPRGPARRSRHPGAGPSHRRSCRSTRCRGRRCRCRRRAAGPVAGRGTSRAPSSPSSSGRARAAAPARARSPRRLRRRLGGPRRWRHPARPRRPPRPPGPCGSGRPANRPTTAGPRPARGRRPAASAGTARPRPRGDRAHRCRPGTSPTSPSRHTGCWSTSRSARSARSGPGSPGAAGCATRPTRSRCRTCRVPGRAAAAARAGPPAAHGC